MSRISSTTIPIWELDSLVSRLENIRMGYDLANEHSCSAGIAVAIEQLDILIDKFRNQ